MYATVSHILLSLLGPVYFGYVHSPYVVLVAWSAACATIFFWSNRASLRHARQVALQYLSGPAVLHGFLYGNALCRLFYWISDRIFGAVFFRAVADLNRTRRNVPVAIHIRTY